MTDHPAIVVPPPRGSRPATLQALCLVDPQGAHSQEQGNALMRGALESNRERLLALVEQEGATIAGGYVVCVHDPSEFSQEVLAGFPPLKGGEVVVRTTVNVTVPL